MTGGESINDDIIKETVSMPSYSGYNIGTLPYKVRLSGIWSTAMSPARYLAMRPHGPLSLTFSR